MFIVFLEFAANKAQAGTFMQGHKEWLQQGFDEGVFLLAGSLQPNLGGGILVHNTDLDDLQQRLNNDPFVAEKVVEADIVEMTASKSDPRLEFLLAG